MTNLRAQVGHLLGRQGHGRRLPTILLQGETGTGKGLLARAIHQASIRATRPFVDIDCAAIPDTLLEAELFGVERGAFTDARQTRPGLFQAATGGMIFLDEVGLLPRSLQAKLLKVVEERGVRRLGSTHTDVVDVWVLAATNIDLAAAVREGSFREDLYHRLSAVTLHLPPLRARNGDIKLLAEHFLARACLEFRLPPRTLAPEALAALSAYHWPGNVRELMNRLERVVLLSGEDGVISAELLGLPAVQTSKRTAPPPKPAHLRSLVEDFERERLTEAIRESRGNVTMAAARLGLPRNTLRYRLAKLGIGAQELEERGQVKTPAGMGTTSTRSLDQSAAASSGEAQARPAAFLGAEVCKVDGPSVSADRALELIVAKVKSAGGRVEMVQGHSLIATFGVYPCEDAILRAASAAMAISMAPEIPSPPGASGAAVRLAVHACQASVRSKNGAFVLDDGQRHEAEAMVNALLSTAEPGTVLASQAAARLLRGRFRLKAASASGDAGSTFQLVKTDPPANGLSQASQPPLVGRQHELDLLSCLFERAQAGRGQVVGIVADIGMGKSRLTREFALGLERSQHAHRWLRFVPYGPGLADLTVVEVLRQVWHIAHEDTAEAIAGKVRSGLDRLGMDTGRWAPSLLALFGIPVDVPGGLGREELKAQAFDALRRVALETSKRQPLVVEVADLELFGKTGIEFLSFLVENLPSTRIFLLTTYGPQYRPPWAGKSYVTQITLPPLRREESLAVLGSILPAGAPSLHLAEAILERAEGNPFFLEELARDAVAGGNAGADLPVPAAVRALIEARMDHLEDRARHLLRMAAAIGRRVPARLLERICQEPALLAAAIAGWKRLELVHEEIEGGETVYAFKEALVWEIAHQSVSAEERQEISRIAALPG